MTFSTALRKSFSVATFLLALMANIPASVHTLRSSAPVALGQRPDVTLDRHALGVNPENVGTPLEVGQRELDLSVDTSRPHQGGVESGRPVGGKHNLDISTSIETIKLGNQFQHSALDFVVTTGTVVEPCPTNSVDFVEKDDACLFRPCHLEQLPNHTSALTHVLLNQLTSNDTDEGGICPVCNCTSAQRLACSRRSVEQCALWRVDTEVHESLW
ncbi:hypothetical protein PspLS_04820 [Pyricularia sp. CBS 133598]|nr:hypothetical protein PspLS_04820 [Pyricularia sp. CBS 133598]